MVNSHLRFAVVKRYPATVIAIQNDLKAATSDNTKTFWAMLIVFALWIDDQLRQDSRSTRSKKKSANMTLSTLFPVMYSASLRYFA